MKISFIQQLTLQELKNYTGVIIFKDKSKSYYVNGSLHREDGPAIEEFNGYQAYYQNGLRHRLDGPARIWSIENNQWWFKGKHADVNSQEEFETWLVMQAFE